LQIYQNRGTGEPGRAVAVDLDCEQALMDNVPQTIDDPGAVEIGTRRAVYLQR
jgi:hypothetical protein